MFAARLTLLIGITLLLTVACTASDDGPTQSNLDWADEFCRLWTASLASLEQAGAFDEDLPPQRAISAATDQAEVMRRLADDLDALVPAKETREFQSELARAYRTLAQLNEDVVALVEEGGPDAIGRAEYLALSTEWNQTNADIERLSQTELSLALSVALYDTPSCGALRST